MKIYGIARGEYSNYYLGPFFHSMEDAEEYIRLMGDGKGEAGVEEAELHASIPDFIDTELAWQQANEAKAGTPHFERQAALIARLETARAERKE